MAERKTILLIEEISDDDCGMYQLGEIDTIPDSQILSYINRRGELGYREMLELAANIMVAAKQSIKEYRNRSSSGECAVVAET